MMKNVIQIIIILMLTGCSGIKTKDDENSAQYLVIGIGLITVSKENNKTGVKIVKNTTLGVNINNDISNQMAIGYSSGYKTFIPDNADNICLEINQKMGIGSSLYTCDLLNNIYDEEKLR